MRRAGIRAIRLLLVLVLSLGVHVQSSRAMLPEIVVGGTVLFQAAQVLQEMLPQLAALGTSIVGLASASKEAGSTLQSLLQKIFPPKKQQAKKSKDIGPIDVPTISGPTDAPATPAPDAPPGDATGDLPAQLSQLVTAYHEHLEPSARAFGGPVTRASATRGGDTSYESLANKTAESLIEAARTNDRHALEKFSAAVRHLKPEDRPAVLPVLEGAVKGSAFSRLHGETKPDVSENFKSLKKLRESVR